MPPCSRRLVGLAVIFACNASPGPTPAPAAPATPAAPTTPATPAEPVTPANPATPAEPTGASGDDWLVWFKRDGVPTTRWLQIDGDDARVLAERRGLFAGAGARVWRIERKDAEVEVLACDCAELDDESACKRRRKLTTLGLRAVDLVHGTTTDLITAATGTTYGELFSEQEVAVVGGVGGKLIVYQVDNAYTCGAHPEYDHGDSVFDLVAGREVEDAFTGWPKQLPAEVRKPAAEKIQPEFAACQSDEGTGSELMAEFARDGMFLHEVSVALEAGAPQIRWVFGLSVTYACSSDYMLPGDSTSGLVPEAAPLGLVPVPAGVRKAFTEISSADAVGWSQLTLGPARDATLAAFTDSPEPPWPSERVGYKEEDEPTPSVSPAREKLDAARRLTRAKDYPAAIAEFDAALGLDPTLAAAWSGRGYARLLSGALEQAKRDLETALLHDEAPAFQAAVHFNLGQVAEKAGDVPTARAAYTRSLELRETGAVKAALAALAGR